jgi:hypothetical protein
MKTYILVGETAVKLFLDNDFTELENLIKDYNGGDIIAWNKETDSVSTLLDMLSGWNDYIELTESDIENIKQYTKIEIV